jgi:deazaflavin-dependent oxidoreductase (nitroreductase family)
MTFGLPTLLLTTTGRRTGRARSTPLLYLRHGEELAVIGTRFGSDRHPAWSLNLLADPAATVLLDGESFRVVAREATPAERDTVWSRATRLYGGFEKYEARASGRVIPVLLLGRVDAG